MNIMIKGVNVEITDAIREYAMRKIGSIEKMIRKSESTQVAVELSKTTNHHKQGDYFRASIKIDTNGTEFIAESEKEDLYMAIDDVREEILRVLTSTKDRKESLYRRGARSVKKMFKGFSQRDPMTSK